GHVSGVGRADGVGDGRGVRVARGRGRVVSAGEVGRRSPGVLHRTGLLPDDVTRRSTGGGQAHDEQHLAGAALLLRHRGQRGRLDVALALVELLAGGTGRGLEHVAGGLGGPTGTREVIVLHVVDELV